MSVQLSLIQSQMVSDLLNQEKCVESLLSTRAQVPMWTISENIRD